MAKGKGKSLPVGFGFGVGAGVSCDSNDESFFCTLTKITSAVTQIVTLLMIAYFISLFLKK